MMPLASWLDCSWRHTKPEGYGTVLSAAQKLDALVWDRHKIKLLYCDDPWRFRDISTAEVMRTTRGASPEESPDYPQLGTHADPTCRHLTADNFYSLIGTRTDRPLPLITMNTAALYEATDECSHVIDLFIARRLWSDHPERDCAGLAIDVPEWSARIDGQPLPAVHLGTAWTREDRRGQGVMTDVSRLHRMVAWLRWPVPQFATVVPNSGASKVFGGRDIGAVIETRDGFSKETRVLFWHPEDIVNDAIAAHGIATPDKVNQSSR